MKRYIELSEIISFLKNYERFEIVQDLINRIDTLPAIEVSEDNAIRIIENEVMREDLSKEIKDYLFSDLRHKLYHEQAEVSEEDLYIPLNNQTVKRINRLHKDECGEYFDEEWLFNELEQIAEFREVSEDAISRRGLLEQIDKDSTGQPGWYGDTWQFIKTIEDAPSVVVRKNRTTTEQSSMVGEWINKQEKYQMAECSNCKKVTMHEMWGDKLVYYDYCPNCGAKMKGN